MSLGLQSTELAIDAPAPAESRGNAPDLDPESDARDALLTLRSYLLAEISDEAGADLERWTEFDAYIGDLCSHGLDTLEREPSVLAAECERMRSQLEDVSCSNYRTLIESFECAGAVRDGVGKIRSRLDQLIDALPPLATATREFSSRAAEAQALRESRLRTLAEYGRVVDILEMPRLMRSFVAGELYDEALELHDLSLKFASMHPDEQTLQSVCAEVNAITRQMILQLISVLRGPLQLPACLRVVGFLRRMAAFPESRLRMVFLQCRGDWLRSSLDAAVAPTPQAKLVRLSDDSRAMIFEIVTQYRAAFADDDEDGYDDDLARLSDPAPGTSDFESECALRAGTTLYDWTTSVVSQYLSRLESGLGDVKDGASLSTIVQQSMYCGQSLGRVGADFRPALIPLFEAAMMRIFDAHLTAALRQFEMMIEEHRWAPVGSSALHKERRLDGDDKADAKSSATNLGDSSNASQSGNPDDDVGYEPPMAVLDSPALAVFLNGILSALNELRSCAMLSLSDVVAEKIRGVFISAAECVAVVGGPGGAFLKVEDRPHFAALHVSLRDLCVPHVARCLDRCMDKRGLVDSDSILRGMRDIFGEAVSPGLSAERRKGSSSAAAGDTDTDRITRGGGKVADIAAQDERLAPTANGNGLATEHGRVEGLPADAVDSGTLASAS